MPYTPEDLERMRRSLDITDDELTQPLNELDYVLGEGSYGKYVVGKSKYIIVAPHAAGDDLYTGEIAESVAKHLNGSALINTKVGKGDADYNHTKDLEGTDFLKDLEGLITRVKGSCYVITIHGSSDKVPRSKQLYNDAKEEYIDKDEIRPWEIDIGCGLTESRKNGIQIPSPGFSYPSEQDLEKFLILARNVIPAYGRGVRRAPRAFVYQLREELPYNATIGREWAAQNVNNLVQYFKGRSDVGSLQLELTRSVRKDPKKLAEDIAEAILAADEFNKDYEK
jgi:hypothetical protein